MFYDYFSYRFAKIKEIKRLKNIQANFMINPQKTPIFTE